MVWRSTKPKTHVPNAISRVHVRIDRTISFEQWVHVSVLTTHFQLHCHTGSGLFDPEGRLFSAATLMRSRSMTLGPCRICAATDEIYSPRTPRKTSCTPNKK